MKTFETYETVEPMRPCRKKPIVVHAWSMSEEFRVKTLEGDYKQGKPGDYLMRGIDGELYICDKSIFERSYDWEERAMLNDLLCVEVKMDTGNLADDPLYKALDDLYHRGWLDRNKGRDYDPRGTVQWQAVLDLFRLQKQQLEKAHNCLITSGAQKPNQGTD